MKNHALIWTNFFLFLCDCDVAFHDLHNLRSATRLADEKHTVPLEVGRAQSPESLTPSLEVQEFQVKKLFGIFISFKIFFRIFDDLKDIYINHIYQVFFLFFCISLLATSSLFQLQQTDIIHHLPIKSFKKCSVPGFLVSRNTCNLYYQNRRIVSS